MTVAESTARYRQPPTSAARKGRAMILGAMRPWPFLALSLYILFLVLPILFSLYTSFVQWDGLSPMSEMVWVGFDNYIRAFFADAVSRRAVVNNLSWTVGGVIIPTAAVGLFLAVSLQQRRCRE